MPISDRTDAGRMALRERLKGQAAFDAAAVGDEVDTSLLADLAAATGGLHVQLTPGAPARADLSLRSWWSRARWPDDAGLPRLCELPRSYGPSGA